MTDEDYLLRLACHIRNGIKLEPGVAARLLLIEQNMRMRADLARAPDPLLEKMVEVLRGVLEGEYITQETEQQARALIAEHGAREGGE
jgi:hypothetical protein